MTAPAQFPEPPTRVGIRAAAMPIFIRWAVLAQSGSLFIRYRLLAFPRPFFSAFKADIGVSYGKQSYYTTSFLFGKRNDRQPGHKILSCQLSGYLL